MFIRRSMPIWIIGHPDNQPSGKWSSTVYRTLRTEYFKENFSNHMESRPIFVYSVAIYVRIFKNCQLWRIALGIFIFNSVTMFCFLGPCIFNNVDKK